jgi:hypothetical protein
MRAIHGHGRWFLNVIALTVYMLAASVRAAFGVEAVLSDDAHTFSSEPASNFGASPILVIRGGRRPFSDSISRRCLRSRERPSRRRP